MKDMFADALKLTEVERLKFGVSRTRASAPASASV